MNSNSFSSHLDALHHLPEKKKSLDSVGDFATP